MNQTDYSSVADLSYRNYDGVIESPNRRYLVIAKAMILRAFSLKSVWIVSVFSGWYYLVMITILFFLQRFGGSSPVGTSAYDNFVNGLVWKDQFLHGFSYGQHLFLVIAIIVGAGTIANDNRANALLVYLSKPCRKIDYLIGKWLGVFVPVLVVMAIPTLTFYLYGLFSFTGQGFFSSDKFLFLKLVAMLPLAAGVHASLILVISSFFKQGTTAGATYAGLYFMGYFFSLLMKAIWVISHGHAPKFVADLTFASIDGIDIGIARSILRPGNTMQFGIPGGRMTHIPNPQPLIFLGCVFALIIVCIWLAWTRIRAVEIV